MSFFFLITAWAFLEELQDTAPAERRFSRAVLLSFPREAAEIFLLTVGMAGMVFAVNAQFSGFQEYSAALVILLFYFYGEAFKRRSSFVGMALACVFLLLRESSFFLRVLYGAEIAVGVMALRFLLKGIQKRQLFFPAPRIFSGLPAFFVTAAIISMILSPLFVR